jgi:hypothetical protein
MILCLRMDSYTLVALASAFLVTSYWCMYNVSVGIFSQASLRVQAGAVAVAVDEAEDVVDAVVGDACTAYVSKSCFHL